VNTAQSIFNRAGTDQPLSNDVQTFRAAYAKYGAGRYVGLTVGNEANDSVGNIMAKVYDVRGKAGTIVVTIECAFM
jgi:hypothetical protein